MKTEKNINVELFRVEGDLATFVKLDYVDKDAQEHTGLMILDSCSNLNFLSKEMVDCIGMHCKQEGEVTNILTATGDEVTANIVRFSFALGGVQFHEKFCINDNQFPKMDGEFPIIGLIGHEFMQQYHLAIDYSNLTLHTSHVSPDNLAISDCDFFFPMATGLKNYNIPVLCMGQGNWEIIAMADTAATNNMISAPTLSDDGFHCEYLGSTNIIKGLIGSVEAKDAILEFDLLTLREEDDDTISFKDVFNVHPQYLIEPAEGVCDENGEQLPPVEALISSPFMAKEGWVLDFGAKIIYKRKARYVWDGNIRVDFDTQNLSKEKGIIPFYAVDNLYRLLFILITEGDYAGVVLLVDTGSSENIMFRYTYNQIKEDLKPLGGTSSLLDMDGKYTEANYTEWGLTLCGNLYKMRFLVKEADTVSDMFVTDLGFPVAGVIGSRFMAEHSWMIDYAHQEIVIQDTEESGELV